MVWWNPLTWEDDDRWFAEIDAKLDAREEALNKSVAEKEAYFAQLSANVESQKQELSELQSKLSQQQKTLNRDSN